MQPPHVFDRVWLFAGQGDAESSQDVIQRDFLCSELLVVILCSHGEIDAGSVLAGQLEDERILRAEHHGDITGWFYRRFILSASWFCPLFRKGRSASPSAHAQNLDILQRELGGKARALCGDVCLS